ncbi:hydroxyacid dehydrogenase [Plantactinospora solaniradicis]|uniref:Hydroxyacid dehydrogenase n=1 Tax=Plantactinospora solaniradicis TaxID=1723736 RepID=A0ABW1K4J0_9ACTN
MSERTKPTALVVMDRPSFRAHFDPVRLERLGRLVTLPDPVWVDELDSPSARARLAEAEVLLTSWGAPTLTPERLAAAPALRAVFHCAGSVRSLVTSEVWRRGIQVTSAADANAIPVAEYTLAAIILAGKKAPFIAANPDAANRGWGHLAGYGDLSNYRRTVGIVGFSRVGRRVVDLLGCLDSTVCLVADPYADPEVVRSAGGTLLDLYEVLPRSEVLSLHAPALPSTRHMIGATELALLPDHATVINTARGSLVDSPALAAECRSGRLFAILDVTEPEPLPADSPLRATPNVMITPHLAGSLGSEILRLSDHALDELSRWTVGEPPRAEVTPEAFVLNA